MTSSINRKRRPVSQAGFTLVEMLIVMVIIGLLGLLVAPNLISHLGKAKTDAAQAQINTIAAAVDLFAVDMGRYPSQQEGLDILLSNPGNDPRWRGPYVRNRKALTDPWGNAYHYRIPGEHDNPFDVFSPGPGNGSGASGDARAITN